MSRNTYGKGVLCVRYQKGLNKNRNHHDSLADSAKGRSRSDSYADSGLRIKPGKISSGNSTNYGQSKHNKYGKPKPYHW